VAQTRRARLPEHLLTRSSPCAIEGLDLGHALLSELLRHVANGRIAEVSALCLVRRDDRVASEKSFSMRAALAETIEKVCPPPPTAPPSPDTAS
jgi:hypothetical protein